MSDSSYSASELRSRYGPGGSVPDDQLSAAQLRARAGIHGNARDFSTRGGAPGEDISVTQILVLLGGALAILAVTAYVILYAPKTG